MTWTGVTSGRGSRARFGTAAWAGLRFWLARAICLEAAESGRHAAAPLVAGGGHTARMVCGRRTGCTCGGTAHHNCRRVSVLATAASLSFGMRADDWHRGTDRQFVPGCSSSAAMCVGAGVHDCRRCRARPVRH